MTDVPYAEIRKLAWYLEHDERNHFEAKRAAGEDVSDHIYLAVRVVLEWLGDTGIINRSGSITRTPKCSKPSRNAERLRSRS